MIEELEGIKLDTYAGKAVIALRTKLKGILGDSGFLLLHLMDIVDFMMLHDKFASKGIFITQDNREEKYIEIIQTGDQDMIDDLERYIGYLDRLTELRTKIDTYNDIIQELKEVSDPNSEEEVNNIVKDYLKKWFTH